MSMIKLRHCQVGIYRKRFHNAYYMCNSGSFPLVRLRGAGSIGIKVGTELPFSASRRTEYSNLPRAQLLAWIQAACKRIESNNSCLTTDFKLANAQRSYRNA